MLQFLHFRIELVSNQKAWSVYYPTEAALLGIYMHFKNIYITKLRYLGGSVG